MDNIKNIYITIIIVIIVFILFYFIFSKKSSTESLMYLEDQNISNSPQQIPSEYVRSNFLTKGVNVQYTPSEKEILFPKNQFVDPLRSPAPISTSDPTSLTPSKNIFLENVVSRGIVLAPVTQRDIGDI